MTDEARKQMDGLVAQKYPDDVRLFWILPALGGFAVLFTIAFLGCIVWGEYLMATYSVVMSAVGWALFYYMLKNH